MTGPTDTTTDTKATTAGTSTGPGRLRGGLHPVHVPHLVLGIAFTGLAVVWLLRATGAVDHDALHWVLPIPWVAAGLAGLLATALNSTGRHPHQVTGWVDDRPDQTRPIPEEDA